MMPTITPRPERSANENICRETGLSFTRTFTPQSGEVASELFHRIARELKQSKAVPLHVLVFGSATAAAGGAAALEEGFGRLDFPLTWIDGADCAGRTIAGVQLYAFTGEVKRIQLDGRVLGSVFTEGSAQQCVVGGLTHSDPSQSPAEQTRQTLLQLQSVLASGGFDLADTVRTWFFLENILQWYDDFNRARTKIYSGVKFRTGSLPASTGVGAKNPAGTALALAAWAFRPLDASACAAEVASPLQCPAPAYGSSFSRAMEISSDRRRRLFISGTASIAPGGQTLWAGDIRKQIELSMRVVEAILHSRGHNFSKVTRLTAYFRHAQDACIFGDWLGASSLQNLPIVLAQCDICRDDLLFELETESESTP
jgi:enamine deaminase RidA (YjgF/YER057c/UK114 family)